MSQRFHLYIAERVHHLRHAGCAGCRSSAGFEIAQGVVNIVLALARDAVLRERLTIDSELRRTLGIALAGIAARGERAGSLVERSAVDDALHDLVARSRHTLAEARQLIRSYHRPSVRAELSTAVALLAAAGIQTRVVLPPDGSFDAAPEFRARIRAATAALLRDGSAGPCVLSVGVDGQLSVTHGGAP